MNSDEQNVSLSKSVAAVDQINTHFYERFQYPQEPLMLSAAVDPLFETRMLNQSVGSWTHSLLPQDAKIWVAGCGTNQAAMTGLKFPNAVILASDLSSESLATAERISRGLGLKNLAFKRESINETRYSGEFDYIICTGVIHHNADPALSLSKLAAALRPNGILELMVYNRYHRVLTTAFQKAIRLLSANLDFEVDLQSAKSLVKNIKIDNLLARFIATQFEKSEAEFADALLQPVEHSYTLESLIDLLRSCGLELLAPCVNQFDKAGGTFLWNLQVDDPALATHYDSLPDMERWKISNHLMMEKSPMLWFYCRHRNGRARPSEQELCQQFMQGRFRPAKTQRAMYCKSNHLVYERSARLLEHPGSHPDPTCRKIVTATAQGAPARMADIVRNLGIAENFATINRIRLCLTTSEFPYLLAVPA